MYYIMSRFNNCPAVEENKVVKEHKYAKNVSEAHPISDYILEKSDTHVLCDYDLAYIQAVGSMYIDELDIEPVCKKDNLNYYLTDSAMFYKLAEMSYDIYGETVNIDNIHIVVEVHTKQYLYDLHDYDGNFDDLMPTVCNAYNHYTPDRGKVNMNNEFKTENIHYGFVDSRGFVLEDSTHQK